MEGHARTKVVIYQFLTTDAGVRSYTRPCGVYGVRSGSGPFFFFLGVLPFSPFIVIFHTHVHVSTFGVVEYIMSVIDVIMKHNTE